MLALGAVASVASLAGCTTSGAEGGADSNVTSSGNTSPNSNPNNANPSTPSATTSATTSATPSATTSDSAPGPAGSAVEVTHGSTTTNSVALTFHGAGDIAIAKSLLLEIERAHGVATVFAVGTWLNTHPEMAKRVLDGGHLLGNHTMHHKPMRRLTPAQSFDEIAQGAAVVRRLSGSTGWFRPSGTPHATSAILAAAAKVGYRTSVSFDVDPADYSDPGENAVVTRVLAGVRPGSIISLHLGHLGTLAAMPAILDGLTQRKLTAVTVATLLPGASA